MDPNIQNRQPQSFDPRSPSGPSPARPMTDVRSVGNQPRADITTDPSAYRHMQAVTPPARPALDGVSGPYPSRIAAPAPVEQPVQSFTPAPPLPPAQAFGPPAPTMGVPPARDMVSPPEDSDPAVYRQRIEQMHAEEAARRHRTDDLLSKTPPPIEPPQKVSSKGSGVSFVAGMFKFAGSVALLGVIIWGGATLLNAFVFQAYYVDGLSMQPSLQDDDRLIVSKVERTSAESSGSAYVPERGQIVVVDGTASNLVDIQRDQLIKRVIGLPGDRIVINDGVVTIFNSGAPNGFNPDTSLGLRLQPTFVAAPIDVTVPEGHVFVMGDNRAEGGSYDSREFGPVSTDKIQGRLVMRILPFNELRVF